MTRESRKKIQQLKRTVVTKFDVRVADALTTQRTMTGSIASRVDDTVPYVSGDAIAESGRPFEIVGISTAIIIQAWRPFHLRLFYGTGELVNVPCSGLFVLYGVLDKVEVYSDEQLRFTYTKN